MQQATRVVAMLLVSLFMQSCAMQQKPGVAIPILGARTTLEIQLSDDCLDSCRMLFDVKAN